jgi:hypothetical protein
MIAGKPVWFVGMVVGGWTAMRLLLVLPFETAATPDGPRARLVLPDQARLAQRPPHVEELRQHVASPLRTRPQAGMPLPPVMILSATARGPVDAFGPMATRPASTAAPTEPAYPAQEAGIPGPPQAGRQSSRWSGAAWMLWRPEGAEVALAPAGRLGGAQAGLRVDYALRPGSPLRPALYGRVSGALGEPVAAEAAMGVALRPAGLPVALAIERRAALSHGGRNDFALIIAGGLYRRPLTRHLRIDGYGQAGMVGLTRPDAFVDGRLTVETVAGHQGSGEIAIGAGLWGGAQPGLARLDIGPQVTVRLPLGSSHVRLGLEWRQRIAGEARPASGPAISAGLDF